MVLVVAYDTEYYGQFEYLAYNISCFYLGTNWLVLYQVRKEMAKGFVILEYIPVLLCMEI